MSVLVAFREFQDEIDRLKVSLEAQKLSTKSADDETERIRARNRQLLASCETLRQDLKMQADFAAHREAEVRRSLLDKLAKIEASCETLRQELAREQRRYEGAIQAGKDITAYYEQELEIQRRGLLEALDDTPHGNVIDLLRQVADYLYQQGGGAMEDRCRAAADALEAALASTPEAAPKAPEPDVTCEHGTAMDVRCCNCHSGFLFDTASCVCTFEAEAAPTPKESE